jgi:hypothetical protein
MKGGSYERQLRQSVCLSLQPKKDLYGPKICDAGAGPIGQRLSGRAAGTIYGILLETSTFIYPSGEECREDA